MRRRLIILCTTTGYQTRAFVEAATEMGVETVFGSDRCHVLDDPWQDHALPLRFEDPEGSARRIAAYAREVPIHGIVALGDRPTPTAARAARLLNLPYHPPAAADICRDKYRSREKLREAGLNVPEFQRFSLESDPVNIIKQGVLKLGFPCVLKPLALSASRGVIRADDADQFIRSYLRIRSLLRAPEVQVMREETSRYIQAESYIEGQEIAVEGLVSGGKMKLLAVFDKPDPLEGPYFEETIYVTPSRLKTDVQEEVLQTLGQAINALGLSHGPFHAELRVNVKGVWPLEIAARSIGGLCSRALAFSSPRLGARASLEKLIIALALGEDIHDVEREQSASAVMMIPIEKEGIYQGVEGVEEARRTPCVEEIVITAKPSQRIVPLPEGASYLGFIFARGSAPEEVEQALRSAHQKLRFQVSSALPVV